MLKIISKTLITCFGLSVMSLYVESSSYDDPYPSTLHKRLASDSMMVDELNEQKCARFTQPIDAFVLLNKLVDEYADNLEKKDARRRRNHEARKEYLNKVNHYGINRYKQNVLDENPMGHYSCIPLDIFRHMLMTVFSFMSEHNYDDPNFKDSKGRHYRYYLG